MTDSIRAIADRLASPDTKAPLHLDGNELVTESGDERFPLVGAGLPLLFPGRLLDHVDGGSLVVPDDAPDDAFMQYARMSAMKQNATTPNTDHGDVWYLKHREWTQALVDGASGSVLDVGCDDPEICREFYPEGVDYLGLDCLSRDREKFRLLGMAEFLPLRDASFDVVSFLGSLDHVFDYKLALREADRVLKPGGTLYLASLVWTDRIQLCTDNVHFHHFADYELLGALSGYSIRRVERYAWKNDTHRESLYFAARKP